MAGGALLFCPVVGTVLYLGHEMHGPLLRPVKRAAEKDQDPAA